MTTRTVRQPIRRIDTTPQRILSLGLASAACLGLVGVIGVRSVQDAAAQDAAAPEQAAAGSSTLVSTVEPTTSTGLTQADLDAYAARLEAERVRLDDYRVQLASYANQVQAAIGVPVDQGAVVAAGSTPVSERKGKPRVKPAPKAKPAPQAQTRSS